MPGITGFEKRIRAYADEHFIPLSRSKAQRLALRIAKRAQAMQELFDFERELRILGIASDPTARDAVRNLEMV